MTLFVVDSGGNTIRQITLDGTVTTLCGSPVERGSTDGKGSASFCFGFGAITSAPDGTLFVADSYTIRRIRLDGTVTTLWLSNTQRIRRRKGFCCYILQSSRYCLCFR